MRTTALLVSVALLLACASQTRHAHRSGFLDDYSMLEPAGDEKPLLFYRNPDFDFSQYDNILIEPVTIWAPETWDLDEVPRDELDRLGKMFYAAVKEELGREKNIVEVPGPRTIRLRLAITEATDTIVILNNITSIHPGAVILGESIALARGTRLFVGKASLEGEATDSMTGELLVAGVDRRQGGKDFSIQDWTHVEKALRFWAKEMREMIGELSAPS